jgi:hypothetical protein
MVLLLSSSCQDASDRGGEVQHKSETTKIPVNAPEEAWRALLRAMKGGDTEQIVLLTTDNGMKQLNRFGATQESRNEAMRAFGFRLDELDTKWEEGNPSAPDVAEAYIGPSDIYVKFVRVKGEWKFDKLIPGY